MMRKQMRRHHYWLKVQMEHYLMAQHHLSMIMPPRKWRDNSPTRKKKIASDAWKPIERIKNEYFLTNYKEGMTCVCVKYSAMVKCSKDKRKGMWLTSRVTQHAKNCLLATEHLSKNTEKSNRKEDENR